MLIREKVSFFLFLSICLGRWRVCFHPARRGARVPTHCHPELVVARLCCQHFAERQNARLARRLLLFPKISLRCDFREPCFLSRAVEWVLRGAYRKTNAPTFMPSPFLRGKGDRLRWMRVDLPLLLSLPITRIVSPHQALRASFPLGGKPCIETCSEQLSVLYKIPRLRSG